MDISKNYDSTYLKEVAIILKGAKQKSIKFLELESGAKVLDLGCGIGIDTFRISKFLNNSGKVIGFDNDENISFF